MGLIGWFVAMATFSMILGFQWSRAQRRKTDCAASGHRWVDDRPYVNGLFCSHCGTRPNWR